MKPVLVACYFMPEDAWQAATWRRLALVFRHSAERNLPGWDLQIREIPFRRVTAVRGNPAFGANTVKLEHWTSAVLDAPNGARLALMDVDTVILRDLDEVWSRDFDVALTKRPRGFPYNGGVVFLRVSARVRAFVAAWAAENRRLMADREEHRRLEPRFGGVNQCALGSLIETGATAGLEVLDLPCEEWNCEDMSWSDFNDRTRVLHVKSSLRLAVFKVPTLNPLANLWRSIEREAQAPTPTMEATP